MKRYMTETAVDAPTQTCPHCLSEIPVGASRCAFCTQEVGSGSFSSAGTAVNDLGQKRKSLGIPIQQVFGGFSGG